MKRKFLFQSASKTGFGVAWTPLKNWTYFGGPTWAWFFSVCLFKAGFYLMYGQHETRLPKRIQICVFGLLVSIPLSLKKQYTQ